MNAVTKLIPKVVTLTTGRTILKMRQSSPTILFVGGVVGVVATTVMASKATLQLEDVLEETQNNLKTAKTLISDPKYADRYSNQDYQKDVAYIYARATVDVAKLYAPALLLGAASIAMLAGSHNILTKRNAALTAAYATLDKAFTEYRGRVVKELGEDKDREFRYPSENAVVSDTDNKGKEIEKKVIRVGSKDISGYARFFDELCPSWSREPSYNLVFLRAAQNYFNDMLQARGHVFLNEVYDHLGIERSSAGSVVGWVISKDGDNFIDFGIFDGNNSKARDFVNGREGAILLDFNVDGVIYDKI